MYTFRQKKIIIELKIVFDYLRRVYKPVYPCTSQVIVVPLFKIFMPQNFSDTQHINSKF